VLSGSDQEVPGDKGPDIDKHNHGIGGEYDFVRDGVAEWAGH
jgi:hypothetical protein